MNDVRNILDWFKNLPLKRQLSLSILLTGILLATTLLTWWVLTPSYSVLFSHLDDQDANQILRQLDGEHIAYRIENAGKDILIDNELINATRIKLMSNGIQLQGNVGFELFDKNDFGMTDFSQKINYQRALQGELERTITSLDEVRQARVHLVIPEQKLFNNKNNIPKAAITLHLKKSLTAQQVTGIQKLVAASVNHLNLKHVIIVDQFGNTLTSQEHDQSHNQFSAKKSIERYLSDKVMQMLVKVFAEQEVMVRVDASLNYDELQRELIKPQNTGVVTHEKEIEHVTPGTSDKDKKKTDITREKSYQSGSEKELFKRANGSIEHLSVSVILPKDCDPKTLTRIQNIVKNIVGFNEARGDTISVEALISQTSNTPEPTPTPVPLVLKNSHMPYVLEIGLAGLLFFGSTTLILIRRRRIKQRHRLLIELNEWLTPHE